MPAVWDEMITPNLIQVGSSGNLSFGIIRNYSSIQDAAQRFADVLQRKQWLYKRHGLTHGANQTLRRRFVPADGTKAIPLNSVLKNNFENGSHVIEFADVAKSELYRLMTEPEMQAALEALEQHVPIRLKQVPERIGNIVFQFPVRIIAVDEHLDYDEGQLEVTLEWHPAVSEQRTLQLQMTSSLDGVLTSTDLRDASSGVVRLGRGSADSPLDLVVSDKATGLACHALSGSFIKSIQMRGRMTTGQTRTFTVGGRTAVVHLMSGDTAAVRPPTGVDDLVHRRMIRSEMAASAAGGSFMQFGTRGEDKRSEALEAIRDLIRQHGSGGVCVWDPFLCADDILQTLFYSPHADATLQAICAGKAWPSGDFEQFRTEQQRLLAGAGGLQRLSVEFRCQHEHYGWGFHDRFLICRPESRGEMPRAWSLGTSVNNLGKTYHMVLEVQDATSLLAAFDELWLALDNPDCLVWKHP